MPHCIHTTKRCQNCGLHNGSSCSIVELAKADHRGPQYYPYKGFFVPTYTEKLSPDVMNMLSEFTEE